jgi:hypothetical protein
LFYLLVGLKSEVFIIWVSGTARRS